MKELPKIILDTRGLLMHMLHRGNDPDSVLLDDGTTCNRAAYGFENFLEGYLIPILEDFSPLSIIAVWDGGKNYRKKLYPKYKANRDKRKQDEDPFIGEQVKMMEDTAKLFLANLGCINMYVNGVEADDVIAKVCQSYEDVPKRIYTVDADLLQLSDDKTFVSLKEEVIRDEYKGVPLNLIAMHKSLVGDASDNYTGVPGFGEKAWEKAVEKYGFDGMEELEQCVQTKDYTALEEAIEATGDKALIRINENRRVWEDMYNLAILHPELCYGFSNKQKVQPIYYKRLPNADTIKDLLTRNGCLDLYKDHFEKWMPTQQLLADDITFDEKSDFIDEHLKNSPIFPFDYETYDSLKNPAFNEALPATQRAKGDYVDVLSSELSGMSFTFGDNLQHTVYIPIEHKDTQNHDPSLLVSVFEEMNSLGLKPLAHNMSFEEQITKQCLGIELEDTWDTQIMSSYVDENERAGLKNLSEVWFKYQQETYAEVMEKAQAEDMRGVTGEQVLGYGCDDAFVSGHLWHLFWFILGIEGTQEFYKTYDRDTVHPLNRAFETGVKIDFDRMNELKEADAKLVEEGTALIRSHLEEHCLEENPEGAMNLFNEQKGYLKAKLRHDGKSTEEVTQKLEEYKLKLIAGSKYVPCETVCKSVDFKPTANQIGKVIEHLDIMPEGYEFKSVAASRITEFLTELHPAEDYAMPEGYPAAPEEYEADLKAFLEALPPAAGDAIKHREGAEYDALETACKTVLERFSPVEVIGDELNFNSPDQMQQLFYCKLGLPIRKRSKVARGSGRDKLGFEGSPGTDDKAVQMAIAEDCEEGSWKRELLLTIGEVKGAMTRESLYYRPYPLWLHPKDDCIHPSVRNCGTVTRRPTGSNPNILQVAKGPTRSIYVPRYTDHVIVPMDFSGQELRITGSEAHDPVLVEAYTGGGIVTDDDGMQHPVIKDIHTVTACSFAESIIVRELGSSALSDFDIVDGIMDYNQFRELLADDGEKGKVINKCRKMAKVVNFLIIYGGGPSTLAMGLGIPTEFAEQIMDLVFQGYPRLAPWQKETIQYAYDHGYVKTAYGTWKHVSEDIRSDDGGFRSRAERQAVNQTVQGCAADILKIVLSEMYRTRVLEETGSVLIAPVYDEVVSSVPIDKVFEYTQRMASIMNVTPPSHPIPMMAEVCLGLNWGDVMELGDNPSEKKIIAAYDELVGGK